MVDVVLFVLAMLVNILIRLRAYHERHSLTARWRESAASGQITVMSPLNAEHTAAVAYLQDTFRAASVSVGCTHDLAVPVDLERTGERVAWWCEACETQLPADFSLPAEGMPPRVPTEFEGQDFYYCAACPGGRYILSRCRARHQADHAGMS